MDEDAQAEAWVRKKPKFVIHDPFLIFLLDICAIALPWVAAGTSFWFIFVLQNYIFGFIVLAAWTTAFLIYAIGRAYVTMENRKHAREETIAE